MGSWTVRPCFQDISRMLKSFLTFSFNKFINLLNRLGQQTMMDNFDLLGFQIWEFSVINYQKIIEVNNLMYRRKEKDKKRSSSGLYLKVIVLGDSGVGKTCLINRYIGGCYQDSFSATLGVDFKIKVIQKNDVKINLQIWDTAGQQRFKTVTKSYFQGCLGVLLMFSLTDLNSFRNIEKWLRELEQHSDAKLVKILIGTKVDSPDQRVVQVNQCSEMASKYDLQYFEVSAKTGYNIENVFETITDKILARNKTPLSNFFHSKSIKLNSCDIEQNSFRTCQC